jgi:hypothetical protein
VEVFLISRVENRYVFLHLIALWNCDSYWRVNAYADMLHAFLVLNNQECCYLLWSFCN